MIWGLADMKTNLPRLALIVVLAGAPVCALADSETVELRVASRGDLQALELEFPDVRVTRPQRRGLSDFLLQVSAAGGASVALSLPDGARPAQGRSIFSTRLFIVSQGQLHADAVATCAPWQRDVSICTMDCDGGQFAVRRSPGGGDGFDLVFGARPGEIRDDAPAGLTLAPCGLETTGEARLVPKAGRALVELPLGGD